MLEDLIVLEVAEVMSGPLAGLILSDLGAKVIKVEPPEWKRSLEVRIAQRDEPMFLAMNRGKRSLVLDLTIPQGRKVFEELVGESDVVLSNFPPSVVKKLGLDYDTLGRINERIICCNISGYGLKGKDVERPAFEMAIQAASGVMSVTGEKGRGPVRAGIPLADQEAGIVAALGILAAYIKVLKDGKGQQVDISMFDTLLFSFVHTSIDYYLTGKVPGPVGTGATTRNRADHRAYQTKDGYMILANGRGDDKWRAVCKILGRPELGTDPRYDSYDKRVEETARLQCEELFEPIFRSKTTEEWLKLFGASDIPCAPVNRLDTALREAETLGRGMIINFPLPLGGTARGVGNPIKVGVKENLNPAPRVGQHTSEVLMELLDYSEAQISELAREKVIVVGS